MVATGDHHIHHIRNTALKSRNAHHQAPLTFVPRMTDTCTCFVGNFHVVFLGFCSGAIAPQRGPQKSIQICGELCRDPHQDPLTNARKNDAVFNPTDIDSTKGHFTSFYHLDHLGLMKKFGCADIWWLVPHFLHKNSWQIILLVGLVLYPTIHPNILLVITPITSFVNPY